MYRRNQKCLLYALFRSVAGGAGDGLSDLCQYSRNYVVRKDGKLSKRGRKDDNGSIDARIAGCVNRCGVIWEDGEFLVESDGTFLDLKYDEEEQDG